MMADRHQHPTVIQKVASQQHVSSSLSQDVRARYGGFQGPSAHTSRSAYGNYSNAGLPYPVNTSFVAANPSPVFIQAPSEKGAAGFAIDFLMGAVSVAVSKSAAAPIERVKLLIQNQDEMIKSGRLFEPYKGIVDCFGRTIKNERFVSLWRGNTVNVIHYFPTQAFRKGSPLVTETSREIAKLREEGKLMKLEKKWFISKSTLSPQEGGSVTKPKILDLHSFGGLFLISGISSALALLICLLYLVKEKLHAKYFIIRFLGGGKLATMISYLFRRNANAIGEVNAR
ncbi:hypothetical protein RJ639_046130 [Escallonia herrerae]|uniref:ADP/ATP translocase n=1 Tax=Escallonia herrerae TaxID=1293975 RepID=A0AA88W3V9_9ASTE|nr:hypothetical protein RJ639_046130 [Escallonia herrerae]